MSTQPKPFITEEQYLEIERKAEWKSEYLNGEMFAIAGASFRHVVINDNLTVVLARELSGTGCRGFSRDLRVRVPATGLYTYPDILVICGKPEFVDNEHDTVTNPKVINEILSPTTQIYDRGNKFVHYRSIPGFREYLLIAQDRIYAEHHVMQPDGGWLSHETSDGEQIISLESIGIGFKLSDAYSGIEL